jgi:hypothetical protein
LLIVAILEEHEVNAAHGNDIRKSTSITVVTHIPATKPEKKKFTHANVSVCKEDELIR